jgi:hypothetical protein
MRRSTLLALGVLAAAVAPVSAQVVINEFAYDDSGTDDREFVELYNAGAAAIDLSGWQLLGQDTGAPYTTITLPAGTSIAAGGYLVLGNAGVPNVPAALVQVGGFLQNDMEQLTLLDGSAAVRDRVVYEGNKRTFTVPTGASVVWSNDQSIDIAGSGAPRNSLGRYRDGYVGPRAGSNFGMRPATPGANNSPLTIAAYNSPNVNALANDDAAPGWTGSFVNPRVIDPTVASVGNPAAVSAAPGGNKAITMFDESGGGNAAVNDAVFVNGGRFAMNVYLNTSLLTGTENETTVYGMLGHPDALTNIPDPSGDLFASTTPTAAGQTGLAWIFQRTATTSRLYLVDARGGGNSSPDVTPQDWAVLQTLDVSGLASGWYDIGMNVTAAGQGVALFNNTGYTLTTDAGLAGNLYVGYREAIAGTPTQANAVAASFSVPRMAPLLFALGDVDDNGAVNNQDIAPFVAALTSPDPLRPDLAFAADVNGDGVINNQDIAPFVALLTGGRGIADVAGDPEFAPLVALVPEPGSLSLLALGGLAVLRRRRSA